MSRPILVDSAAMAMMTKVHDPFRACCGAVLSTFPLRDVHAGSTTRIKHHIEESFNVPVGMCKRNLILKFVEFTVNSRGEKMGILYRPLFPILSINGKIVRLSEDRVGNIDIGEFCSEGSNKISFKYQHSNADLKKRNKKIAVIYPYQPRDLDTICRDLRRPTASASKIFFMHSLFKISGNGPSEDQDILLADKATFPILCPLTKRLMSTPGRHLDCKHAGCFDLREYLNFNYQRLQWKCPICAQDARPNGLYIDAYVLMIVKDVAEKFLDKDDKHGGKFVEGGQYDVVDVPFVDIARNETWSYPKGTDASENVETNSYDAVPVKKEDADVIDLTSDDGGEESRATKRIRT